MGAGASNESGLNLTLGRAATAILLIGGLAATAFFWAERQRHVAAKREYARIRPQVLPPYPLVGLRAPIPELVNLDGAQWASRATRHLVIAVSDTCPFCIQAKPSLCAIARLPELAATDEVIFVSLGNGVELARESSRCGKSSSANILVATPKDEVFFAHTTGIAGTPSAVLLDKDWRFIRSIPNGELTGQSKVLLTIQ